jgi:hypothetical protein
MFFVKITPDFGNTARLEIVGAKNIWRSKIAGLRRRDRLHLNYTSTNGHFCISEA